VQQRAKQHRPEIETRCRQRRWPIHDRRDPLRLVPDILAHGGREQRRDDGHGQATGQPGDRATQADHIG
jgi:hypothetical protein